MDIFNNNQMPPQMPVVNHVLPDFIFNEGSTYNKVVKVVGFTAAACGTFMAVDMFMRNADTFLMSLRK